VAVMTATLDLTPPGFVPAQNPSADRLSKTAPRLQPLRDQVSDRF